MDGGDQEVSLKLIESYSHILLPSHLNALRFFTFLLFHEALPKLRIFMSKPTAKFHSIKSIVSMV